MGGRANGWPRMEGNRRGRIFSLLQPRTPGQAGQAGRERRHRVLRPPPPSPPQAAPANGAQGTSERTTTSNTRRFVLAAKPRLPLDLGPSWFAVPHRQCFGVLPRASSTSCQPTDASKWPHPESWSCRRGQTKTTDARCHGWRLRTTVPGNGTSKSTSDEPL